MRTDNLMNFLTGIQMTSLQALPNVPQSTCPRKPYAWHVCKVVWGKMARANLSHVFRTMPCVGTYLYFAMNRCHTLMMEEFQLLNNMRSHGIVRKTLRTARPSAILLINRRRHVIYDPIPEIPLKLSPLSLKKNLNLLNNFHLFSQACSSSTAGLR